MPRDARADAEAQLSKAQSQLDAMTVLSTLRELWLKSTVMFLNLQQGASQVVVHVVSNENLQVKGNYLNITCQPLCGTRSNLYF